MTPSLRSRLILGMFMGMAMLQVVAGATIYTVQRRQLYRAFDDTLLGSANALALLIHPGPFGYRFDSEGLARLPVGKIRQGALFQLWSDRPIDTSSPRRGPDSGREDAGRPGLAWNDRPPPEPGFPGPGPPPGPFRFLPPPDETDAWRNREPGKLVIRSALLGEADLPRLDAPLGRPRFQMVVLPGGAPGRAVGLQFQVPGRAQEPRWVPPARMTAVVAADAGELEKQLSFLGALLAATALGTMAVSGGAAWLVVSRGLRPLAAVARTIATLDETGLKQRLANGGVPREIEPVVQQLNGLLGRLDEAFDRERALTADVAHELRTPVAEIRAIAEITLNRLRDPEEYRQALGETLDAVRTLQGLIEKLLVLARLEAGQIQPELRLVPLKPVVAQHWAQVRNRAEARGVTFTDRCPRDGVVFADPKLLEVVVSNVLSNAATYALDRGSITADAQRVGTRYQLRITNTGCALSEREVAQVFDRFWRADAARGKIDQNCGLGLTLVRRAMEAMGGQAEASVSQERCFTLTLTFADKERPSLPR